MNTGKLRVIAGACAAIFGVVGTGVLSVGLVVVFAEVIGLVAAIFTAGAILFVLAGLCLFILARPDKSAEAEISRMESLTAEALADLPFDTLKALIEKRPVASLALAATTGYGLSRNPEAAVKNFQRVVMGLI